MAYKAVFFDMDGTVLNTLDDLHDGVNAALAAFGMPPITLEQTRCYVGNGALQLISLSVPAGTDAAQMDEVLQYFKNYYQLHSREKTAPYAGILSIMERLAADGIKQAVVSNKPDAAVKVLAEQFFPAMLDCAAGERPDIRRKPAPDMLLAALESMGVTVSDCVYIGDSEVDIATAKNAGMDCISVSWGYRTREELNNAGASRIVDSPKELYEAITGRP